MTERPRIRRPPPRREPTNRNEGALSAFLGRMIGAPNVMGPKMGLPARPPQYFVAPPYPGAPPAPPPLPPELPLEAELKLLAVPFEQARWRPSDGALDMSPRGGLPIISEPAARGMEPPSAPPMPQEPERLSPMGLPESRYIAPPDPAFAAALSRSLDQLDGYRAANQRELDALRERRDRYAGTVGDLERRRRGGTGGGGY
jgi:hypothetical protein